MSFNVKCENDHTWSAYFNSHESLKELLSKGLVDCPECGSVECEQALSMPNVGRKGNQGPSYVQQYRDAVRILEENTEDVGREFADTAIRMAEGREEERAIRGKITEEDAERMDDAGVDYIPYTQLPDPKKDMN